VDLAGPRNAARILVAARMLVVGGSALSCSERRDEGGGRARGRGGGVR
jgi:hypothetical protein